MSESEWFSPRHNVREPGHPYRGCAWVPTMYPDPAEPGKWWAQIWDAHAPAGEPAHFEALVHVFDGMPMPDGTRAFPMDHSMLSIHRHPGGRCPSEPHVAAADSPDPVQLTDLHQPSEHPHLVLLEGGKEAAA